MPNKLLQVQGIEEEEFVTDGRYIATSKILKLERNVGEDIDISMANLEGKHIKSIDLEGTEIVLTYDDDETKIRKDISSINKNVISGTLNSSFKLKLKLSENPNVYVPDIDLSALNNTQNKFVDSGELSPNKTKLKLKWNNGNYATDIDVTALLNKTLSQDPELDNKILTFTWSNDSENTVNLSSLDNSIDDIDHIDNKIKIYQKNKINPDHWEIDLSEYIELPDQSATTNNKYLMSNGTSVASWEDIESKYIVSGSLLSNNHLQLTYNNSSHITNNIDLSSLKELPPILNSSISKYLRVITPSSGAGEELQFHSQDQYSFSDSRNLGKLTVTKVEQATTSPYANITTNNTYNFLPILENNKFLSVVNGGLSWQVPTDTDTINYISEVNYTNGELEIKQFGSDTFTKQIIPEFITLTDKYLYVNNQGQITWQTITDNNKFITSGTLLSNNELQLSYNDSTNWQNNIDLSSLKELPTILNSHVSKFLRVVSASGGGEEVKFQSADEYTFSQNRNLAQLLVTKTYQNTSTPYASSFVTNTYNFLPALVNSKILSVTNGSLVWIDESDTKVTGFSINAQNQLLLSQNDGSVPYSVNLAPYLNTVVTSGALNNANTAIVLVRSSPLSNVSINIQPIFLSSGIIDGTNMVFKYDDYHPTNNNTSKFNVNISSLQNQNKLPTTNIADKIAVSTNTENNWVLTDKISLNPARCGAFTPTSIHDQSTLFGVYAGNGTSSSNRITAFGYKACEGSGNGSTNTGIGYRALDGCSGVRNVGLGYLAGNGVNGNDNFALGEGSMDGGNNSGTVGIGRYAFRGGNFSNSIGIGVNIGGSGFGFHTYSTNSIQRSGSNKLLIGNNTSTAAWTTSGSNTGNPYLIDGTMGTNDSVRDFKINADSIYFGSSLPTSNSTATQIWNDQGVLRYGSGSALSYTDTVFSLPSQTGNDDKFLKTNGTNPSWTNKIGSASAHTWFYWTGGIPNHYLLNQATSAGSECGNIVFGNTNGTFYSSIAGKIRDSTSGQLRGYIQINSQHGDSSANLDEEILRIGESSHTTDDAGEFFGNLKVAGVKSSNNNVQTLPVITPTNSNVGKFLSATSTTTFDWHNKIGSSTAYNWFYWSGGIINNYLLSQPSSAGDQCGAITFGHTNGTMYGSIYGKIRDSISGQLRGYIQIDTQNNNGTDVLTEETLRIGESSHTTADAGEFFGNLKLAGVKFSSNNIQTEAVEAPTAADATANRILTATGANSWAWSDPPISVQVKNTLFSGTQNGNEVYNVFYHDTVRGLDLALINTKLDSANVKNTAQTGAIQTGTEVYNCWYHDQVRSIDSLAKLDKSHVKSTYTTVPHNNDVYNIGFVNQFYNEHNNAINLQLKSSNTSQTDTLGSIQAWDGNNNASSAIAFLLSDETTPSGRIQFYSYTNNNTTTQSATAYMQDDVTFVKDLEVSKSILLDSTSVTSNIINRCIGNPKIFLESTNSATTAVVGNLKTRVLINSAYEDYSDIKTTRYGDFGIMDFIVQQNNNQDVLMRIGKTVSADPQDIVMYGKVQSTDQFTCNQLKIQGTNSGITFQNGLFQQFPVVNPTNTQSGYVLTASNTGFDWQVGGASNLLALSDVFETAYTNNKGKILTVNDGENGMKFGGVFDCDDSTKRINIGNGQISDMQNNSIAIGHDAGKLHSSRSRGNSVFLGVEAGKNTSAPVSGAENSSHDNTVCVGYRAGSGSEYYENSVIIGADAGYSSSMRPHSNAVLVGAFAGYNSGVDDQTTGNTYSSTHIGTYSGKNVRGLQNVSVGRDCLYHYQKDSTDNTSNNLAMGNICMRNTIGSFNSCVGTSVLRYDNGGRGSANKNVGIGFEVMCDFNQEVKENVAIGHNTMRGAGPCQNNIALGFENSRFVTGNSNIAIGRATSYQQSGSNNIYIGNFIRTSATSNSNELIIGNNNLPNPIILGKMESTVSNSEIKFNAKTIELSRENLPTSFDSNYPDRIWIDGAGSATGANISGVLRIGPVNTQYDSSTGKHNNVLQCANSNSSIFAFTHTSKNRTQNNKHNLTISVNTNLEFVYLFDVKPSHAFYIITVQHEDTESVNSQTDLNSYITNKSVSGFTLTFRQGDNGLARDDPLKLADHSVSIMGVSANQIDTTSQTIPQLGQTYIFPTGFDLA